MPRFRQFPDIVRLMGTKENVRNVGILAHIDHGKTTMTDSLLAEAGILSRNVAGQARALDYLEEEQKRGITIKTANISLLHKAENRSYVINLVDTPGHVDFTGKVTRALRAIDGAIVVVDAVEGLMVQTETVTKQALNERVRLVLFVNKVDRLIRELRLTSEEIQNRMARIISDFNSLIETYGEPEFKREWKVDPVKGNVAFGSALHKWGFTVHTAKNRDIRFDDVIKAYRNEDYTKLVDAVPLHEAILSMVVRQLPDPSEAAKYRIPKIWKGNLDSEIGQAMLNCDPKGPTVMCVTNVQADPSLGLIISGRLFSGSIQTGDQVYLVDTRKQCNVQQVSVYMGAFREAVDHVDAGNIAALLGLEKVRSGETLVDVSCAEGMVPFERITYVSEPVMTVALEPKNPKDLRRLVKAMRDLTVDDPNLAASIRKETGEYLLSGIGELHLEIAVKSLKDHAPGLEVKTSSPIVVYRETVSKQSPVVLAKSPNKQNLFSIQVESVDEKATKMLETKNKNAHTDLERIKESLNSEAGWSVAESQNVWAANEHTNVLVDLTKNHKCTKKVKKAVINGFRWACQAGPLCEEPMRGLKVKLLDAQLHEDPSQSGPAQIIPAVRKAIFGAFLSAGPVLLEPVFRIQVTVPTTRVGEVDRLLAKKHGKIILTALKGTVMVIDGYIPVAETLGLASDLRTLTSGSALWQTQFDHWGKVAIALAAQKIVEIRKRKGLSAEVPSAKRFLDEA
jgi:elongation factor 2